MTVSGKDWCYQKWGYDSEPLDLESLCSDELLQLACDLTDSLNEVLERMLVQNKEDEK